MARLSGRREEVPIIEQFRRIKHATYSIGTSAVALPTTNMSFRKGLFVQNNHASNGLYLGGADPEFILGNPLAFNRLKASGLAEPIKGNATADNANYVFYDVKWKLSGAGTNEWYAVASTGSGTPSITQPTILYYATASGGTETLGTSGTPGSLAAQHNWGWGDADTLGFNTLYIRTDGTAAANSPTLKYDYLMLYNFTLTADTASTGGLQVDAGSTMWLTLDGTCRLFAIANGASTPVTVMEVA
jgi:hypothetical protein